MMHSKWAEDNPVYGDACSFIKRNGTEGFWFSTNCSEESTVICMDKYRQTYMLSLEAESSTHMYQSTWQSFNHSTAISHTGSYIYSYFIADLNYFYVCEKFFSYNSYALLLDWNKTNHSTTITTRGTHIIINLSLI